MQCLPHITGEQAICSLVKSQRWAMKAPRRSERESEGHLDGPDVVYLGPLQHVLIHLIHFQLSRASLAHITPQ